MKYVYLGPARPFGLPIMPNAILADAPEAVYPATKELFAKHRNFHRLFAPIDKLAEARAALKIPGSPLSVIRDQIALASKAHKKEAE